MNGVRKLDYAERWLHDGLLACRVPAFFESLELDMTHACALVAEARRRDCRITFAHVIVRAAALALAANPDLHRMVCGNKEYSPECVDVAVSVGGETAVAPLLVIEGANAKPIGTIAAEIARRTPEVQEADRRMLRALRRWGRLVPLAFLRRLLLTALFRNAAFRRKGSGTFQVSVIPGVDQCSSPLFSAAAMLMAGKVCERVIAIDGKPAVRHTAIVTCCADHRVWDGLAAQRFLQSVRQVLESPALFQEWESEAPRPALKAAATAA